MESAIIFYILFSIIIGIVAKDKTLGFWGGFILSLLFSPIIGLIIALLSKNKTARYQYNPTLYEPSFKKKLQDRMEDVDREIFKGNKEKALDILMDMAYDVHKRIKEYGNPEKYDDIKFKIIFKIKELGGTVPEGIK